jgi:pSer/pThr/pTyr-binding forkhead associated (FHA) protein
MTTLHVMEGPAKGKQVDLESDIVFVGRGAKNDIQINDYTVSRMHLKIFSIGTAVFVEDLKSSNGTLVNGVPLEPGEGRQVEGEDLIALGDTVIRLVEGISSGDPDFGATASRPSQDRNDAPPMRKTEERRSSSFREMEFISKLSELLRSTITIGEALQFISERLLDMLPRINRVTVFIRDQETADPKHSITKKKTEKESEPFSLEAVEEAFSRGRAVTVADATNQAQDYVVDEGGTMQIKSLLCVPMTAHARVLGALYLDGIEGPYAYRNEDALWIETAGTLIAYALENAELSFRMSRIADLSSPKN